METVSPQGRIWTRISSLTHCLAFAATRVCLPHLFAGCVGSLSNPWQDEKGSALQAFFVVGLLVLQRAVSHQRFCFPAPLWRRGASAAASRFAWSVFIQLQLDLSNQSQG